MRQCKVQNEHYVSGKGEGLDIFLSVEALFYRTCYTMKIKVNGVRLNAQTLQLQVPSTKTIVLIRR